MDLDTLMELKTIANFASDGSARSMLYRRIHEEIKKIVECDVVDTFDFDVKYKEYLEEGFYGLAINDVDVIKYLDKEFEVEIEENPDFQYSQIKLKFGSARVYTTSEKNSMWEKSIDNILFNKTKTEG